ncbi:MAG: transporter [Alteromonadaceae bacterium]|nr:MAG: transporter [Alteromonadaceae bacterium]
MSDKQPNNPLHGITLEKVVTQLVDHYGWDDLAYRININCFKSDPSVKSSLKFLRKTQWARDKVEKLYLSTFNEVSPWKKKPDHS